MSSCGTSARPANSRGKRPHETTIGPSDALQQSERAVVGVKHHLLRLARVARINSMRGWQKPDLGVTITVTPQQDHLVAPVELLSPWAKLNGT